MAVFKNYYNRKSPWAIAVSCLYLLCSTISCSVVSAERVRHHHTKVEESSQVERNHLEDSSKHPMLNCPNCVYEEEKSETDKLRLEAIKRQILQKLGLRQKPNITSSLPKEVIWETLYRAGDDSEFLDKFDESFSTTSARSSTMETVDVDDFYGRTSEIIAFAEEDISVGAATANSSSRTVPPAKEGKRIDGIGSRLTARSVPSPPAARYDVNRPLEKLITSPHSLRTEQTEIIHQGRRDGWPRTIRGALLSHADEFELLYRRLRRPPPDLSSRLNKNRLLQFRAALQDTGAAGGQMGQELRVRTATLWLKADFIKPTMSGHDRRTCRSTDIFVFKIISNRLPESVTLSSRQFDRIAAEPVSISLEESHSGWQKIDLTDMVQRWLSESSRDELKLFVDCSCCSNWRIHLFNNERSKISNPNRPFLVIHTDPSTAKRVRKRAIDCSLDSGNECCKQRFYVNFKALGWDDWVIAPHGYFANYCRGDCAHHRTPDTYITYHTHVIEEVRKTQHLSGMTPCCAPLKFSSMSLIYYGPDSTIIKRDLPKMVVDECGCP